jgi:(p)ppGpp synthase/HD superfamily hydrolase
MRELAQTNLQLYDQLTTLGWASTDLAAARGAYELAAQLFSARYRASGKTFIAHVVGTASCVAAVDSRAALVTAGLLHAAYQAGDFGRPSSFEHRRSILRAHIGPEAEDLVHAYTVLPWSAAALGRLLDEHGKLSARDRDVVLLRLANEVDEHVDCGVAFADRNHEPLYADAAVDTMCELAVAIGHRDLAQLLDRVRDRGAEPRPAELHSDLTASVLRPPASYRRSHLVSARAGWIGTRQRLARVPWVRTLFRRPRR